MPLRHVDEFEAYLDSSADAVHVQRILELSWALKAAIPRVGYTPAEAWAGVVKAAPAGAELLEAIRKKHPEATDAMLAYNLLRLGCYYELLISPTEMDDALIRAVMEREQQAERLRWPHRWGRVLYDKFFTFASDTETSVLTPDRTETFLNGCPLGLHQYGHTLLGPLGVLVSSELRHLDATRRLPLWHCSDTGCLAHHDVLLAVEEGDTYTVFQTLMDEAERRYGRDHQWTFGFAMAQRRKRYRHVRRYWDLPALLVEGLTEREVSRLAVGVLRGEAGKRCRNLLRAIPRYAEAADSPTDVLVGALGVLELIQAMLVLEDKVLVAGLDECARNGDLDSATYGRRVRVTQAKRYRSADASCELSKLGVRAADKVPCPRLVRLIYEAYESCSSQNALGWRISTRDIAAGHSDVMEFVMSAGPRAAIEQLVLCDIAITQHVARALWLDLSTVTAREHVVEHILWKAGFCVPDSVAPEAATARHLESLRERAEQCSEVITESDREALRAYGVNAFVGLESALQRFLVWNVWLLGSDHFVETRFSFDEAAALVSVARVLGRSVTVDQTLHQWSTTGRNTLGCLLGYLGAAARWWSGLPTRISDDIRRPGDEMPHFEGSPHVLFPFRHRQLWADCSPPQLEAYVGALKEVVEGIYKSDAAAIRNGLDHWRRPEEFPTPSRIAACARTLESALARAYELQVMPATWWLTEAKQDIFNRVEWRITDSRGRRETVYGPTQVAGLDALAFGRPYLVVGRNLLGLPNATLRFDQADIGEHQRFWADYPLRREIPRRVSGSGAASGSHGDGH